MKSDGDDETDVADGGAGAGAGAMIGACAGKSGSGALAAAAGAGPAVTAAAGDSLRLASRLAAFSPHDTMLTHLACTLMPLYSNGLVYHGKKKRIISAVPYVNILMCYYVIIYVISAVPYVAFSCEGVQL
jgi:hypothetical protein